MAQKLIQFFEKLEQKNRSEENLRAAVRKGYQRKKEDRKHPQNHLKSQFGSENNLYHQTESTNVVRSFSEKNLSDQSLFERERNRNEEHFKVSDDDDDLTENYINEAKVLEFDENNASNDDNSKEHTFQQYNEVKTRETGYISNNEDSRFILEENLLEQHVKVSDYDDNFTENYSNEAKLSEFDRNYAPDDDNSKEHTVDQYNKAKAVETEYIPDNEDSRFIVEENLLERHMKVSDDDGDFTENHSTEAKSLEFDQNCASDDDNSKEHSFDQYNKVKTAETGYIDNEDSRFILEENLLERHVKVENENYESKLNEKQILKDRKSRGNLKKPTIPEDLPNNIKRSESKEEFKDQIVANKLLDIESELIYNINKLYELDLNVVNLEMKTIEISLLIDKAMNSLIEDCDRDDLKEFYTFILDIRNNPKEEICELKLILVKIDNIVANLKNENTFINQNLIKSICQNIKNTIHDHLLGKKDTTALILRSAQITNDDNGRNNKDDQEQMKFLCKYYEKSVRVYE